jgi:hypothetical protein
VTQARSNLFFSFQREYFIGLGMPVSFFR